MKIIKKVRSFSCVITAFGVLCIPPALSSARAEFCLPPGVKAVWDLSKAYREATPTRERICINGLWRWQPVKKLAQEVPVDGWGYFKVPGPWPGTRHWMHRESQTHYPHPDWKNENLSEYDMAWYQREITIPKEWSDRRITVSMEYLNSYAAVFVDGNKMGEILFPGGEVDITSSCRLGRKHVLSVYTAALPLNKEIVSYAAEDSATRGKSVARRGLCGDVFLSSTPAKTSIKDVKVDTSVRKWEITFDTALKGLDAATSYSMCAQVIAGRHVVKKFESPHFTSADLINGRLAFTDKWKPSKLWDIHTPQNMYEVDLSLIGPGGTVIDTYQKVRFGFRELWIDGRDFCFNGTRLFCFAVPLDNAQIGPALASYDGALETMKRLKKVGVNTVYTHNYGCAPGSHLGFEEIFRAADDAGMLISLSLPHARSYDWDKPEASDTNGYARHAEFYIRMAQNHPSVVLYSVNHNMLGYAQDMNPDFIDGLHDKLGKKAPRKDRAALLAGKIEEIVKRFDTTRILYHHSSGNCGPMYTINCYLNFVPIQERSDWFKHWATEGVKPLFLCEYGVPLGMSWTLHRGWEEGKWYKGKRHYTNGKLQYQFCTAEWGSQFLGDASYNLTEQEKGNIRFEAGKWRAGETWYRWDYPFRVHASPLGIPNLSDVQAMYIRDNWRAYRAWGVSALNIWHRSLWKLRKDVDTQRKVYSVDWDNLQKPGFSPDFIDKRFNRMDTAYEISDWVVTKAGKAFLRNNQPLLAFIGGKPAHFTGKDHNFYAGETVEKQIIIINNSREKVTCDCSWSFELPEVQKGSRKVIIETGEQERIPLRFVVPAELTPGDYTLEMRAMFSSGDIQEDRFTIHVLQRAPAIKIKAKTALFDPKGETCELLSDMGVQYDLVDSNTDLSPYSLLIVGKGALNLEKPAPDIGRVTDGLKVLVFEQGRDVLEKRFGFRVQEYGLRRVFKRIPDHPALSGLDQKNLHDWRGSATIVPPRLEYKFSPKHYPTIEWCGMKVTRAWRCGNYGNVATVFMEKPARGDFLPVLDGGFNLQYSPLLEYREGKGMVMFCQMDVTGRTENDPAAKRLVVNIFKYMSQYVPEKSREAVYVGNEAGRKYFERAGISPGKYTGGSLNPEQLMIVGTGGTGKLSAHKDKMAQWLENGGRLLLMGLNEKEAEAFLSYDVQMKKAEHICACFKPAGMRSPLAGIGPADVCVRDPLDLPLVSGGANVVGNGVLAVSKDSRVVFCQLCPWQFDFKKWYHMKISFRRTAFLVSRLLANMGSSSKTPLISHFSTPVKDRWYKRSENRYLSGFYLENPVEMDDPYRFFRW
jgi:beta-galactosidase